MSEETMVFGQKDITAITIVCPKCKAETDISRPLPPVALCHRCGESLPTLTVPAFGHDPVILPVVQVVDTLLQFKGTLRFRVAKHAIDRNAKGH